MATDSSFFFLHVFGCTLVLFKVVECLDRFVAQAFMICRALEPKRTAFRTCWGDLGPDGGIAVRLEVTE